MALYDPNEFPQEVETSKDFTLADVLAWARTKPAGEAYDIDNPAECALAQFGKATGRTELVYCCHPDGAYPGMGLADVLGFNRTDETTFGALVARLEKALA